MTFWRRLKLFSIGLGLGVIAVIIFFGNRDFNTWTPQARILTTIDSSAVEISARTICQLNCLNLEKEEWKSIQSTAKVNLTESNTRKKPCPVYQLNSNYKEEEYTLIWEVCEHDERVNLLSISRSDKKCNC
ncbi:MAG: hypothetical protein CMO34_04440 [Verrucomicrobia bacterium]|nr:hypothetical protein [Verrucomicrobiota bacterium]|tara:strand:- start:253 stop:645 length:393 start_codon:yes stop_codon:yes gene_type:complete